MSCRKTISELKSTAKQGFDFHQSGQREPILDEWPALELFKAIQEPTPMEWVDWIKKWMDSGGKIFGNQMIALKNDPVWSRISKFDLPYPPFDEYDVMWIREVDRTEAERLGLISRNQKVQPQFRNWDDDKKQIHRGRKLNSSAK